MKIKVAVLDNDISYLNRIVAAFGIKYSEKMELYSFTEYEIVISILKEKK